MNSPNPARIVPRRHSARYVAWTTAAMVLVVASLLVPTITTHAQTEGTEEFSRAELDMLALSPDARAIAFKLQCPICDGQSITESNATIAKQMRAQVQQLVDEGRNEDEILDFFEERYGPAVLREPRLGGFGIGAWVVPPIIALFGLVILARVLRRSKLPHDAGQRPAAIAPAEDEEIVARELDRMNRGED